VVGEQREAKNAYGHVEGGAEAIPPNTDIVTFTPPDSRLVRVAMIGISATNNNLFKVLWGNEEVDRLFTGQGGTSFSSVTRTYPLRSIAVKGDGETALHIQNIDASPVGAQYAAIIEYSEEDGVHE